MPTLTQDQWKALSPYLDEALALPEAERSRWLAALRRKSPEIAERLDELFRSHRALSGEKFLESGSAEMPGKAGLAGQSIGVYTLQTQIGQGGMGSVWLAERNDGRFQRQVAVKFLNIALMGQSGEQRFKREGNILARLSHPHIAELIDAGITQAGQPYIVLENIEGQRIDEFCDQQRLGVEARIRLFLDVLSAVAHAHSNLIVHRDLKPANVLVRHDGQAKLLDFGIAMLLEVEGQNPATKLTIEGAQAMTPWCAAPEQVRGEPVTTATDVYALGVLLYVLLTGRHPAGAEAHSPAELVRAIMETDPLRPSEMVTVAAESDRVRIQNAARRRSTPHKLNRLLRGDLDTIVAKAIKKEPAERYASVTAMAEDLRRYLRNETISARPDTLVYRTRKFVRRHAAAVALTSLTVLASAGGVAGTMIQARTARVERDFALRQLVRAQTTIEFNEFLLSDAAPLGKPFTVNELLGRAEEILAHEHTGSDDSRVGLMVEIGDQYSTQDQAAKARRILEDAYLRAHALGSATTRAMAACALAGAIVRTGEGKRAETLIQEGLRELPSGSQYDLDRFFCLRRGSEVAQDDGDSELGVTRMLAARELLKRSPFNSDSLELHALMDLAEAYRVAGRMQLAETTFNQAAALLTPLGRDKTQSAVVLFNDWALALDRLGRPLESEKLFRRAMDISRAGPNDEAVSPMVLKNYSTILRQLGRLEEAADYAERAYVRAARAGDEEVIYNALYARALIYIEQHQFDRAEAMLSEAEPRMERAFAPGNFWFGALASAKAMAASGKGNFALALELADRGVSIVETAKNSGRSGGDFLPIALYRRSTVELDANMPDRAAADAQRSLNLWRAGNPQGKPSSLVGRTYAILGRALQIQGKHEDAVAAFLLAAENLQTTLGADHPDTRSAEQMAGAENHRWQTAAREVSPQKNIKN
jgi:serine/threonine protein kinase